MRILHNPFYYVGTIKESRLFIGRKREVAEICEAIAASASVSVVGERRVGKSSLMQYLADPTVKQKNGLQVARYVFAYFDFLGYPTITPTELWRRLLTQALSQLSPSALLSNIQTLLEQEKIELAALERLMQSFKDAGFNLVILFDEFDAAAANPNFDQAFFGGLRNLSKYPLSYIVASHRTLSDLRFAHPDAIISPFFNFFRRVTLGGFTREEVETLINVSLQGTDATFDAADRELLNALAGSHPFFLQTAAYFLFDAYRYDYRTERIRKGFAWIDVKAVSTWLIKAKGAEGIVDLITKLLQLLRP